jgi:hypothetical protein
MVDTDPRNVNLNGLIDMHIHTAPDVRPRAVDDIEAARQAAEAGMRGLVYKSHITCTADRAFIAQEMVPTVSVFGGLVLNDAVGGINPVSVEAALSLGSRVVWMPTISARNHPLKRYGKDEGICILGEDGRLLPAVYEVLELLRHSDAILATGHLSVSEIVSLVPGARAVGVDKVVITHPEVPWVDMSRDLQKELRDQGAYFERCFVSTFPEGGDVDFTRIITDIRSVGVTSTVLATDFGAATLPLPVVGMRRYVAGLLAAGFSEQDVRVMGGETPAMLLGLDV